MDKEDKNQKETETGEKKSFPQTFHRIFFIIQALLLMGLSVPVAMMMKERLLFIIIWFVLGFTIIYLAFYYFMSVLALLLFGERDRKFPFDPSSIKVAGTLIVLAVLFLFASYLAPVYIKSHHMGELAVCETNLDDFSGALEAYSESCNGSYPPSLDYLTKGNYLTYIPHCSPSPSGTLEAILPEVFGNKSIVPYGYEVSSDCHTYTLWCNMKNRHSVPGWVKEGCWPQYTPEKGLRLTP